MGLMAQEDYDARRFLFVITDGDFYDQPESLKNKLKNILAQKSIPVWDRQKVFTLIFQTKGVSWGNPQYGVSTVKLNNLASVIKFMKEKDGRAKTSEESKTDED